MFEGEKGIKENSNFRVENNLNRHILYTKVHSKIGDNTKCAGETPNTQRQRRHRDKFTQKILYT